jgi:hypothetical protein
MEGRQHNDWPDLGDIGDQLGHVILNSNGETISAIQAVDPYNIYTYGLGASLSKVKMDPPDSMLNISPAHDPMTQMPELGIGTGMLYGNPFSVQNSLAHLC